MEFVENKGQWGDKINFRAEMTNGAFALQKNGYKVLQHNPDDLRKVHHYFHGIKSNSLNSKASILPSDDLLILHSHSYDVEFLNANPNPTIIQEKPIDSYNNYFIGNDKTKWASDCKIFTSITYKNMYDGIDVRYYTSNGTLKYDFIVHPGADASKITMYFNGVNNLKTKNGDLLIKTSINEFRELYPYTYQINTKGKQTVNCAYEVKGNFVKFKLDESVDKTSTLVIDPVLIFCTFTGSTGSNWGYTATYDGGGNYYAGGINLESGFPVSPGAFQTTFAGGDNTGENQGYDISIFKFNATGTNRLYATYIGGSNSNEQPHSMIVDKDDNLIIAGRTKSTNYPTTLPNLGPCGSWDIVLTKLNATGTALINSRKIGGLSDDGVNVSPKYGGLNGSITTRRNYGDDARSEVILDEAGNIYLASCTQSAPQNSATGGFPVTNNAAQQVGGTPTTARYQDGVVIKTSPDLSNILFSTLIGGNGDDAAFVLAINPTTNNIYVGGTTASTDLPGDKTGVLFAANQGGTENVDGFVTILSNDGSQFIKTSYFGTNGVDMLFGIQFDKNSFPYIMGTTTGNWPILNAPYNQPNGKQFIAKLQPDLSSWVFSTRFGPNSSVPNISPFAFLVDRCGNIYVSGWGGKPNHSYQPTQSTAGLPTTAGALKTITDGQDMYFIVLEKNANSILYGSFFGQDDNDNSFGEHVDGGTSRFDKNGVVYQSVCANCYGRASFPTHPSNVWSPTNAAGLNGCNLAAIKIAFNFAGVGSYVQSSVNGVRDTSGCVPFSVTFKDSIGNGTKFIWNFGDGTGNFTTTVPNTQHTFTAVGDYRVKLISIDSSSCNVVDSSFLTLRVRNDDALLSFVPIKQAPCTDLKYNFNNTSIAPASKPFKSNSFRWNFGDGTSTIITGNQTVTHSYASPGSYKVTLALIDTNYCNEPDSVWQTINVSPYVKASFETNAFGCVPYSANFKNTSLAGTDFLWDFGDGTTSTDLNPTHIYNSTGTYIIKLVVTDLNTCNLVDSTKFSLIVSPNPTASFSYSPNPPLHNTPINFINNSTGATSYKWLFGDDDSLVTNSITASVYHIYNTTKVFNACLIASNQYNCRDTSCTPISARVIPLVDVPSAFTPNGDGKNDIIYIDGFGIAKMNWTIYNRWGTVVFSSTSKTYGWNGTYTGKPLPQDVYSYVLDIEFTDGSKTQKKGDITLLR